MLVRFQNWNHILLYLVSASLIAASSVWAAPGPKNSPPAPAASSQNTGDPRSLDLNEKGVAAVQAKNFALAEDSFRKALGIDPKNLTAAFNLASVLLTQKKEQQAIELLTSYTNNYPNDAGLFVRLGDAYFTSKKLQEAATAYEKALALEKSYPGIPTKLATVYGLMNRLPDSERLLLQAVEQNPKDGQALASLSSVFLANGKPHEAINSAKRALQIKPSSEVYVTLGTAYEILKDYKNSLISFQRAVDLGDKREDLKRKIEALQKVVT